MRLLSRGFTLRIRALYSFSRLILSISGVTLMDLRRVAIFSLALWKKGPTLGSFTSLPPASSRASCDLQASLSSAGSTIACA